MTRGLDLDGAAAGDPQADARAAAIEAVHAGVLRELAAMRAKVDKGMVCADTAAALVYVTRKTISNWRHPSCKLAPSKRLGFEKRGRSIVYSTREIARWRVDNLTTVNF